MRNSKKSEDPAHQVGAAFKEVEARVKAMVSENVDLKARVRNLEQELAEARSRSSELTDMLDKQQHIKEKVERVLLELEAIGVREQA